MTVVEVAAGVPTRVQVTPPLPRPPVILMATAPASCRPFPVMVSVKFVSPRAPDVGLIEVIEGPFTVNALFAVIVPPKVVITMLWPFPKAALFAMTNVAVMVVALVAVALFTVIPFEAVTLTRLTKFDPVMVTFTAVPRNPLFGLALANVGAGSGVPPLNSTAPGSNAAGTFGSGRALPKKSVAGCGCETGMLSIGTVRA